MAAARPAWVDVDASFEARKLSATGKVRGIKNPGLRRATADNRARAAMSSRYQRFIAKLGAELAGDTFDPKPFAASLMSGVQIVDHWEDASNDVLYARAELDFAPFFEAIAKDASVPAEERERLLAAAERAWEGLDED